MVVVGEYEECSFTIMRQEENITAVVLFADSTNYTFYITKSNSLIQTIATNTTSIQYYIDTINFPRYFKIDGFEYVTLIIPNSSYSAQVKVLTRSGNFF